MSEFSLIHEPWIRVRLMNGDVNTVSLLDAFIHAHEYLGFAGEMVAQDVAILRMMLAVLHRIFSQVDEMGQVSLLEDEDDALTRWETIWNMGCIPENPVRAYFDKWYDRFYLFDDEHPFYQVPESVLNNMKSGGVTAGGDAARLNGLLFKSGNKGKAKILAGRDFTDKLRLSYDEAARWLLFLQAYDDGSLKPQVTSGNDRPKIQVGYCGRLGLIAAHGDTLFETLMFNWTLLRDGKDLWDYYSDSESVSILSGVPCWELDEPRTTELMALSLPSSPVAHLTIQPRRIVLLRDDGGVYGYRYVAGDCVSVENAFVEQMTLWHTSKSKKDTVGTWLPDVYNLLNKSAWRSLGSIISANDDKVKQPGVVLWLKRLQGDVDCDDIILDENRLIQFDVIATEYGSSNCSIKTMNVSSVSFNSLLLSDVQKDIRECILTEIEKCNKTVSCLRLFAQQLEMCKRRGTDSDFIAMKDEIEALFYAELDRMFPIWLSSLSVNDRDSVNLSCQAFRANVGKFALKLADQYVRDCGLQAMLGRVIENAKSNKKQNFNSVNAYLYFRNMLYKEGILVRNTLDDKVDEKVGEKK